MSEDYKFSIICKTDAIRKLAVLEKVKKPEENNQFYQFLLKKHYVPTSNIQINFR